jgi:hypothetical protein
VRPSFRALSRPAVGCRPYRDCQALVRSSFRALPRPAVGCRSYRDCRKDLISGRFLRFDMTPINGAAIGHVQVLVVRSREHTAR